MSNQYLCQKMNDTNKKIIVFESVMKMTIVVFKPLTTQSVINNELKHKLQKKTLHT